MLGEQRPHRNNLSRTPGERAERFTIKTQFHIRNRVKN
jgi:hypothetical protein